MHRKVESMKTLQSLLCLAFVFAFSATASADWLSPGTTYTLSGDTLTFPSNEWSLFNATKATEEALKGTPASYTITNGMLDFKTDAALHKEPTAYMALGISQNATGDRQPIAMIPETGSTYRTDNVYTKVTFIPSQTPPSVEDLKMMYPTATDRQAGDSSAAKIGVFVNANGYFCFARAVSGTKNADGTSSTTADGKDMLFDYCQTDYIYPDGGGAVTVRVEFHTYAVDTGIYTRVFRLWVDKAKVQKVDKEGNLLFDADGKPDCDDVTNVCLTKGKGYELGWASGENGQYTFDYSTLEQGDWLPLVDSSYVAYLGATNPNAYYDTNLLDTLNYLAFSATGGGFHSAWLSSGSVQTLSDLENAGYDLGDFSKFKDSSYSKYYEAWASQYGVDLTQYLEKTDTTALTTLAGNDESTEYAYNAFLLNMDPSITGVEQKLNITGLVLEKDTISMTVTGPTDCDFSSLAAAKICVRRAAEIDKVASATPTPYEATEEGNLMTIVLDKGEVGAELPFMQATLVALPDLPQETTQE